MKIGVALGGGGVHGVAHVLILEKLDELGLKPTLVAGTSMGAIIGALYCSGLPGLVIRDTIQKHTVKKHDSWRDVLKKRKNQFKLMRNFAGGPQPGGLFRTDRFLSFLLSTIHKSKFEDLGIPLIVVASDFWTGKEVTIEKGDLQPALRASIAVPGVFPPVEIEEKALIDGGMVNVVPYEHLFERCDLTIAVNVLGGRTPVKKTTPNVLDSVLGSFEIMQQATFREKLKNRSPDLLVTPDIVNVQLLDFSKTDEVFEQAIPAADKFKEDIQKLLRARTGTRRG